MAPMSTQHHLPSNNNSPNGNPGKSSTSPRKHGGSSSSGTVFPASSSAPAPAPAPAVSAAVNSIGELEAEDAPLWVLLSTYLGYLVLIVYGHVRDFFGKTFKAEEYAYLRQTNGFAPLNADFESFYTRRLYRRIRDCWNRPVTGVPGRTIHVLERESRDFNKNFKLTGKACEMLNFSSYNYLGFAQAEGPCAEDTMKSIELYGIGSSSPRMEAGTQSIHRELEKLVARFVGKEDALVLSMGFATNSTTLPALVEKGCLLISDELNHSSIVTGSRISGASIRVFKHNDPAHLEEVVRLAIGEGQPRTGLPWKKILIVVEGLYSMEGSILRLPEIVAVKKKYQCYLYMDEAHSIGAMGPNGKGICDYYGVDPADVDILMGTFTKSFGAAGGYIAGSKDVITHLRMMNHGSVYAEAMTAPIAQQVLSSMKIILGEDERESGKSRIDAISFNATYFRNELKKLGFIVYGHDDSPVIPLLLFNPAKIPAFSRELLKRGLAVVVVGYPATPIITSRARFCMSAAHTKEDLDEALRQVSEVGDILQIKVSQRTRET